MKGKIGAIILGIVMVFCLIACIVCLEKIPAGYVGVVYNMNGGVDGEVLTQGWHLVAPTKEVRPVWHYHRHGELHRYFRR